MLEIKLPQKFSILQICVHSRTQLSFTSSFNKKLQMNKVFQIVKRYLKITFIIFSNIIEMYVYPLEKRIASYFLSIAKRELKSATSVQHKLSLPTTLGKNNTVEFMIQLKIKGGKIKPERFKSDLQIFRTYSICSRNVQCVLEIFNIF